MAPTLRSCEIRPRTHKVACSGPANVTGFNLAVLPPELLLEIVEYFPSIPVPCGYMEKPVDKTLCDRQFTLRTLSQLCRSFRNLLLPYVWRHIEVCSVKSTTLQAQTRITGVWGEFWPWEKEIAVELVRQLEIMTIRNPAYAAHVQTVSVFIGEHSIRNVLRELARCLALMPNLKTLQYHGVHLDHVSAGAFLGYSYPSIRTVVGCNLSLLPACPEIRHVHLTHYLGPFHFTLRQHLEHAEKLTGIVHDYVLSVLGKYLPNLKFLQLPTLDGPLRLKPGDFHQLLTFHKLEVIEIVETLDEENPMTRSELQELATAAGKLLTQLPTVKDVRRVVKVRSTTRIYSGP